MRVRLTDDDRERLGCGEWLDIGEFGQLLVEDAVLLEQHGVNWSSCIDSVALSWKMRVWLGLHRDLMTTQTCRDGSCATVGFDKLSFNLMGIRVQRPTEPDQGKAPEPDSTPTSPTSDFSTPPTDEPTT